MGDLVKINFGSSDPGELVITEELNDAMNLAGMYRCVEIGEMSIEDYNAEVTKFNKKWGYVDE